MKKLVIGLLFSVASCTRAAESGVLTPWQKAVSNSDTATLKQLWEKDKTVPTNQDLAWLASESTTLTLATLIRFAKASNPPVCTDLLLEKVRREDGNWSTPLAAFAVRGRIDECKTIIESGISPYAPVVHQDDLEQNLFEFLISKGFYGDVQEIQSKSVEQKLVGDPEEVNVLKAAFLAGNEYGAIRYVLHHNLFNAQQRVNNFELPDNSTLLLITANSVKEPEAGFIAELLLGTYSANPNLQHAKTGATAFHVAAGQGKKSLVRILKQYGADETITDKGGATPAQLLASSNSIRNDLAMTLAALTFNAGRRGMPEECHPQ